MATHDRLAPATRAPSGRSVLEAVLRRGPVSRAELARITRLSKQTTSEVMRALQDSGWVRVRGRTQGAVGNLFDARFDRLGTLETALGSVAVLDRYHGLGGAPASTERKVFDRLALGDPAIGATLDEATLVGAISMALARLHDGLFGSGAPPRDLAVLNLRRRA